jgi:hypothetical protein
MLGRSPHAKLPDPDPVHPPLTGEYTPWCSMRVTALGRPHPSRFSTQAATVSASDPRGLIEAVWQAGAVVLFGDTSAVTNRGLIESFCECQGSGGTESAKAVVF